jgi:hypothetical protein
MTESLSAIYRKGSRRKIPLSSTWYKQPTEDARCPAENRTSSITDSYWNTFGCTDVDQPYDYERKMNEAKKCASERMADMYHHLEEGNLPDAGHVYPIRLAYGLGKKCAGFLSDKTLSETYTSIFRNWYNQLAQRGTGNSIDSLFRGNQSSTSHPLLGYNAKHNHSVRRAKAPRRHVNTRANPVIHPQRNTNENGGWESIGSYQMAMATATQINKNTRKNKKENSKSKSKSKSNNNNNANSNTNFLSSPFAQQKQKGKRGGRRTYKKRCRRIQKTTRRRIL